MSVGIANIIGCRLDPHVQIGRGSQKRVFVPETDGSGTRKVQNSELSRDGGDRERLRPGRAVSKNAAQKITARNVSDVMIFIRGMACLQ